MPGYAVALCLAVVLAVGVWIHHDLAHSRQRVAEAWQQVEALLEHRHGLAYDLVLYMEQSQAWDQSVADGVLTAARLAKESHDLATRSRAENALSAAILTGFHTIRSSTEDKEGLSVYQQEWLMVEEKVVFAKRYYNDVAASYNARLGRRRNRMMRRVFGLRPKEIFTYNARFKVRDRV
ncbi:MAG: LemA family protein [Armatimonadetes bacterium]|nr:LemA family protein [Armatimonadota bacterium]